MSARLVLLLPVAALLSACATRTHVAVLQPAMVDVPPDVVTIGVIDRSTPANLGENILGALEGAITGEGIGADREGAGTAVQSLVHTLEESPRFEVVRPSVDRREADSGIFDKDLDHRTVKRICKQAGCDALLALEAFDSDSKIHFNGNAYGGLDQIPPVTGPVDLSRESRVLSSWRLYDADEDRILDESRETARSNTWSQHGETFEEARRGLPSQLYTIRWLGEYAGTDYGMRIAPSWVSVGRHYYGKGSPELKQSKHYVRASDWEGAKAIWADLLDHPSPKISGRAHYDMALALEVEGNLEEALTHAKTAAVKLHNGKARGYVWVLERRIADQARLEEQLAPPPPEEREKPRGNVSKPSRTGDDEPTNTSGKLTRPR